MKIILKHQNRICLVLDIVFGVLIDFDIIIRRCMIMPFKIVKNNMDQVTADVIVNITNSQSVIDDMTVTEACAFNAKYVIHTVRSIWIDGRHGEWEALESCYTKCLIKALELGCESVAFPLISTDKFGFLSEKALQIAVSVFSRFLLENEMQIILVVLDQTSFPLSSQIVEDIDHYINTNYVKQKRKCKNKSEDKQCFRSKLRACDTQLEWSEESMEMLEPKIAALPMSIEDELNNVGTSFHHKLFELIDQTGMDNKDVWKLANLDRKHFSKIQCNEKYHPKKKTVMALCIALQLDLDQSKDLLARADWAFSPSRKVDLIVQKAIEEKQYDIFQLNMILFKYTNEILGV